MNRRMRKKRHVGEYQEFGFNVRFRVRPDPADLEFMIFNDEFILQAVEGNLLGFGGGIGETVDGFVCFMDLRLRRKSRQSVSPEQRAAMEKWLNAHPRVYDLQVGPLVDAWYGPFED